MIPVIIVTHNNALTISKTIKALMKTIFEYDQLEIFIIDNNSTDGTREILKMYANENGITAIFLRKNVGFPKAAMIGLLYAKPTTYFALLNPDAIPTPYWLQRLYETMNKDSKIGIAQSL